MIEEGDELEELREQFMILYESHLHLIQAVEALKDQAVLITERQNNLLQLHDN